MLKYLFNQILCSFIDNEGNNHVYICAPTSSKQVVRELQFTQDPPVLQHIPMTNVETCVKPLDSYFVASTRVAGSTLFVPKSFTTCNAILLAGV